MSAALPDAPKVKFADRRYHLLGDFSREAWGHPGLFLKKATFTDVADIDYVDFSKYLPNIKLCLCGTQLGLVISGSQSTVK